MAKHALPPRSGDGREIGDIVMQARLLSSRCLEVLGAMIEDSAIDPRTRFTVAKFLLELGWGKPRQMAAPVAADRTTVTLDGRLEEIFKQLTEGTADDDACLDRDNECGRFLPCANQETLE